jgi:hypothetical protein
MSNIPMIIDLSVDEDIEEIKRPHIRKTIDPKWFDDYPWLETESVNGNTILYCKVCRNFNGETVLARGISLLRIDRIKNHMKTTEHKKSEELLRSNISRQLSTEELEIISKMRIVYCCSKNNISLNTYPDLCKLTSLQTENKKELINNDKTTTLKPASLKKPSPSKSKYGSYNNHASAVEFLDSIAYIIKKSLFEELNSSIYWSIMIDEANSVDDDKYLAIVGKYIINNMPYMRYLGMINLGTTDGENIFNQIISFCTSKGISYHNIIHFGSDGASNMIGMD